MMPCLLITGAGVRLALPTIVAPATADLPPARAATGSAVVNMSRQVDSVPGVSVLGRPVGDAAVDGAFDDVRRALAVASVLSACAADGRTPRTTQLAPAAVPAPQ